MGQVGQNKAFQITWESLHGGTTMILTTTDRGGPLHGELA